MAKLICFPVKCGCGKHAYPANLPHRMAHSKNERCPFVVDEYQYEVKRGTCCTFDGQEVVRSLLFWEEPKLAARASVPRVTCDAVRAFGLELEDACENILSMNAGLDERKKKEREALGHADTIGAAGSWYQKVAAHGFGVVTESSC